MILSQVNAITNDVWTVTFTVQQGSLSQSDSQLISKFGMPTINSGHAFTFENTALNYTIPDNFIRVITDLPFTQSFDSTSAPFNQGYSNLVLQTTAYITYFITTYTAAFTTLRANVDTFSGQTLITI